MTVTPFWRHKPLSRLTQAEWESLCDGCAKCCLLKLEDDEPEPGEEPLTAYTQVACQLLDLGTCRCTDYLRRARRVPDCIVLRPDNLDQVAHWLPGTCAYRLLHEGQDLPWWHPLISGEQGLVHRIGVSLRGAMVPEEAVAAEDLEDYIIPQARIDSAPASPADVDEIDDRL